MDAAKNLAETMKAVSKARMEHGEPPQAPSSSAIIDLITQTLQKRQPFRPGVSAYTAHNSRERVPPTMRSHMPPEQKRQFEDLMPIFDQDAPISPTDAVSQLGAARGQQGDIGHFKTRVNAMGMLFQNNKTPEDERRDPLETKIIKEAGFDPANVEGKIIIGPDAVSGKRRTTIPHELAHKGGADEVTTRLLDLLNGRGDEETKLYLEERFDLPFEKILKAYAPIVEMTINRAIENLTKERKSKEKK